jgi:hypothetical protein
MSSLRLILKRRKDGFGNMGTLIETPVVKEPKAITLDDLDRNKTYYVLTDLGELSEFKYLGSQNIKLPCGGVSFLVESDQIFII